MEIKNTTSISLDLIKAVAQDVGLDLNAAGVLEVEYKSASNAKRDGVNGHFYHYGQALVIGLNPWSSTATLAHELRHAYQCQVMGADLFEQVYQDESDAVGYHDNALEVDAREAGERWKL